MLSSCWQAASAAGTKIFANILWSPKLHYRFQKIPALILILSQLNLVRTTSSFLSLSYNPS
jgi:hypothetical protein